MATDKSVDNNLTVEEVLNHLPRTEMARKTISEWLHSCWDNENPDDRNEDVNSSHPRPHGSPEVSGDKTPPNDGRGTLIPDTAARESNRAPRRAAKTGSNTLRSQRGAAKRGSTVRQDGPMAGYGLTASHSGPNSQKSLASMGRPINRNGSSPDTRADRSRKRSSRAQATFSESEVESSYISSSESEEEQSTRYSYGKRALEAPVQTLAKRSKMSSSSESGPSSSACFEPAHLVKAREGTVKVLPNMQKYLDEHLKSCLSKEEREALFKEYPKPDLDSCTAPKVDTFIADYLGKRMPKEHDSDMSKIQSTVLAIIRPLTTAWQKLSESGIDEDPEMVVRASEVLAMIQCTLCLVGNSAELISQMRRKKILEVVDTTWSKYGAESNPNSKAFLFGDDFQKSLTEKVERDSAISKAASLTKRGKREREPTTFFRKEGRKTDNFFRGGPPAKYGSRQGKSFFPYNTPHRENRPRQFQSMPRQRQRPLFHEPRFPVNQNQKIPQRKP